MMLIKTLLIQRQEYGKEAGQLKATITTSSGYPTHANELKIDVPEEIAVQILRIAAPALAAQIHTGLENLAKEAEAALLGAPIDATSTEE